MLLAGADRHPFAGFQAEPVDLGDCRLNGFKRHVFLEDQPDGFRFFLVDEQFLGERIGTVAQHRDAATEFSALLAALNGRANSVYNQVPLECRECDQNIQQHPSGAVGCVDVLRDADEVDVVFLEEFLELGEVDN